MTFLLLSLCCPRSHEYRLPGDFHNPLTIEVAGTPFVGWSILGKRQGVLHESHLAFLTWAGKTRLASPMLIIHECTAAFPVSLLEYWFDDKYEIFPWCTPVDGSLNPETQPSLHMAHSQGLPVHRQCGAVQEDLCSSDNDVGRCILLCTQRCSSTRPEHNCPEPWVRASGIIEGPRLVDLLPSRHS